MRECENEGPSFPSFIPHSEFLEPGLGVVVSSTKRRESISCKTLLEVPWSFDTEHDCLYYILVIYLL